MNFMCAFVFLFGFEDGMWDWVLLIPDNCLSIYFKASLQIQFTLDILCMSI